MIDREEIKKHKVLLDLASIPFNIKGINLMGKVLVETIQAAYENGKIKLKEDKS